MRKWWAFLVKNPPFLLPFHLLVDLFKTPFLSWFIEKTLIFPL